MHFAVVHLARRGLRAVIARQAASTEPTSPVANGPEALRELLERLTSPATICPLLATTILFGLVSVLLEYPLRHVIGNLAIVESPTTGHAADESMDFELDGLLDDELDEVDDDEDTGIAGNDKKKNKSNGGGLEAAAASATVARASGVPITKKIRTTIRHLRSIGGFRSLYRGFGKWAVYLIILLTFDLAEGIVGSTYELGMLAFLAADTVILVITSGLHCAWTHATIRAPAADGPSKLGGSAARGRSCIPFVWSRHLLLPVVRLSWTIGACQYGGLAIAKLIHSRVESAPAAISLAILPAAVVLLVVFFMVIPAIIALVRVEASLLPEGDRAVVPFDRTFGGRIDYLSSQSAWQYVLRNLTTYGAWKTFDREAYTRVVKVYLKYSLVMVVFLGLFVATMALELYAIFGSRLGIVFEILVKASQ